MPNALLLMAQMRMLYLPRLLLHAPSCLLALLQKEADHAGSFTQLIMQDIQWIQEWVPPFVPNTLFHECPLLWFDTISAHPKKWKRFVNHAVQLIIQDQAHHGIRGYVHQQLNDLCIQSDDGREASFGTVDLQPILPPAVVPADDGPAVDYVCYDCGRLSLQRHHGPFADGKHGIRSLAEQYAAGQICLSCSTWYCSRRHLMQHLSASTSCLAAYIHSSEPLTHDDLQKERERERQQVAFAKASGAGHGGLYSHIPAHVVLGPTLPPAPLAVYPMTVIHPPTVSRDAAEVAPHAAIVNAPAAVKYKVFFFVDFMTVGRTANDIQSLTERTYDTIKQGYHNQLVWLTPRLQTQLLHDDLSRSPTYAFWWHMFAEGLGAGMIASDQCTSWGPWEHPKHYLRTVSSPQGTVSADRQKNLMLIRDDLLSEHLAGLSGQCAKLGLPSIILHRHTGTFSRLQQPTWVQLLAQRVISEAAYAGCQHECT